MWFANGCIAVSRMSGAPTSCIPAEPQTRSGTAQIAQARHVVAPYMVALCWNKKSGTVSCFMMARWITGTLRCRINQSTAFTGEGNTLGGGAASIDQNNAAAAREARAKAAEARLAAMSGQ